MRAGNGPVAQSRAGSLFFWRDRTREVDFVVDRGGDLELYEAKGTELPSQRDAVNLRFVRDVVGARRVVSGGVVCRTRASHPLADGMRAVSVEDLAGID